MADWILRQIASVPGPESAPRYGETMRAIPGSPCAARCRFREATPARRLKTQWRKLAAATS